MKNILMLILLLSTVSVGFSQVDRVPSQQRQFDPAEQARKSAESLQKEAELSDEMTNQAELIFLKYNQLLQNRSQGMREEMRAAMGDREAMMEIRDRLRAETEKVREERDAEFKEVLSKKEYKKYIIWDEKQAEKARNRMGRMRGGQGQPPVGPPPGGN